MMPLIESGTVVRDVFASVETTLLIVVICNSQLCNIGTVGSTAADGWVGLEAGIQNPWTNVRNADIYTIDFFSAAVLRAIAIECA